MAGELLNGELRFYEQTVGGANRSGGQDALTGRPTRLMMSAAVWIPKKPPVEGKRTCLVRTVPERLWCVYLDGDTESWNLNEDQIRRWNAAYQRQLQRLREDGKLGRLHRDGDSLNRRRKHLRLKHQNRIRDAIHKASAMLATFCRRKRVAFVIYDDHDKRWLADFPWHDLRQMCKDKCEAMGISFRCEDKAAEEASGAER
jgi:transposase